MANELRVYANWIGGLVEDNPLAAAATTLTSAGLAAMPAIGSTQHLVVVFDPDGLTGAPFAKRVTAHTASATTATIEAAAVIGTARDIARDTPWVHAAMTLDVAHCGCTLYRSTTQAITTATWTAISFDTEVFDTDGFHEGVTNPTRFTVPTGLAGWYEFRGGFEVAAAATGNRYLKIAKNGIAAGGIFAGADQVGNSGMPARIQGVTPPVLLAVADYVEIGVYQDSGGSLNIAASTATDVGVTWFSGERLRGI